MAKSVEDIKIYRIYLDFICYIEMITEKFPKSAKNGILSKIKQDLYSGMEIILLAYKTFPPREKLDYLIKLDIKLKMLKVYARICYRKKYINKKNYEAWSHKLNNIGTSLGAWVNVCLKQ